MEAAIIMCAFGKSSSSNLSTINDNTNQLPQSEPVKLIDSIATPNIEADHSICFFQKQPIANELIHLSIHPTLML